MVGIDTIVGVRNNWLQGEKNYIIRSFIVTMNENNHTCMQCEWR